VVGLRLLERRQLLALDVLHQRQLQELLVRHLADGDRDAVQPGLARLSPAMIW
jgi:hypothetical protein